MEPGILLFRNCEKIHCYIASDLKLDRNSKVPLSQIISLTIKWDPLNVQRSCWAKKSRVGFNYWVFRKHCARSHVAENGSWSQFWRPRTNNLWENCGWFLDRKKHEKFNNPRTSCSVATYTRYRLLALLKGLSDDSQVLWKQFRSWFKKREMFDWNGW